MKPINLKITGINSFNETQEIDFSNLLENGIFGIFGNTGSGKSTIIDAITLALYGKIVRYNGRAGNGDFLNLNRNNGKVEFIFSIKDGKDRYIYEIIRHFKRDTKGSIKSDICRFSLIKNDEREIISDKIKEIENKITNIIGLNYEDFTRAVILPQGKFSEFLLLENKEKRKMLERIFGLEKYGDKLQLKINEKKNFEEHNLNKIKDEIKIYGDISTDEIQEDKKILLEQEELLKKLEIDLKRVLEKEEDKNSLIKFKTQLEFYKNKLKELTGSEEVYLKFKNLLEYSLEADKILQHINEKNNIKIENETILNQLQNLRKLKNNAEKNYIQAEKNYELSKKEKLEKTPELEKKREELEKSIGFDNEKIELEKEIIVLKKEVEKIEEDKLEYSILIQEKINDTQELTKKIEELNQFNENNQVDRNLKEKLKEVLVLSEKEINLKKEIYELKKGSTQVLEQKEIIKEKIEQIEETLKNIIATNKASLNNQINENIEKIKRKKEKNTEIKKEIEEIETQLKIQENKKIWKEIAEKLKEGEECPLCGSKNHPNPLKIVFQSVLETLIEQKQNYTKQIEDNEKNIQLAELENNSLNKYLNDIQTFYKKYNLSKIDNIKEEYIFESHKILEQINAYENKINIEKNEKNILLNNLNKLEEDLAEKETELKTISNNIENINIDEKNILDIKKAYEKIEKLEEEIQKNNKSLIEYNQELLKNNEICNSNKAKIQKFDEKKIICNTKIELSKKNIDELSKKIKSIFYEKEPSSYLQEIKGKILEILEKEEECLKKYENYLNHKNNAEKNLIETETKYGLNLENIQKKEKIINEFLEKSIFENEEECLQNSKTDEEKQKYKKKIKSYEDKFIEYNNNISKIKEDFNNNENFIEKGYKIEQIDLQKLEIEIVEIKETRENIEKEKKKNIENIANAKMLIQQKEETFKKIENLQRSLQDRQKNFDVLKELSDINKGGVFVEYIANSQLKHIVFEASKRLSYMSQNKYSLLLIDGIFAIQDNYNGGVIRSTRSLSGGEIFMASLSLALSLSSKIQLKNKSPLEVFFLDEGFGTLDSNVLDTVINTLEHLQSKNIGVGIITHMEEIKNRVNNKIMVEAGENGAKINIE